MVSREKGPVWGGAAEEWQQKKSEHKKEVDAAIKDLAILFDTDNFQDLIGHIKLLEEGEITDILIGEKTHPIKIIKELIKAVIKDFSREDWTNKVRERKISDEKIIKYLKERGITGAKIDEESSQGFRDCILLCIKKMCE